MQSTPAFGTGQLFLTDARLVLAVLNHLRYQALNRAFGTSREQANVLTAVVLLSAADAGYETARWIAGLRPGVSANDAAVGAVALRDAALGIAGPSNRRVPEFGALVALAVLGGLAAPSLRRAAHRMHAAEQRLRAAEARVRRARIRRYVAARDHVRP
jgi:hypothetical protein